MPTYVETTNPNRGTTVTDEPEPARAPEREDLRSTRRRRVALAGAIALAAIQLAADLIQIVTFLVG